MGELTDKAKGLANELTGKTKQALGATAAIPIWPPKAPGRRPRAMSSRRSATPRAR